MTLFDFDEPERLASAGRKFRAKVVLPAPFGPGMMMIFFK